ncbi:hypothetical protein GCM10025867_03340 [Frondihabitans sucicola]|uniref:Uncharacterized protein n=1 Tax=Frondihabitans sucicola TaxID=1268041 RepID=A0ABM8GI86_9MICO|nr:hypothetical protein [Frondihabitans sucicola]BDZ48093.1 hypothetical protein GCM10025867_03340 [Frondihabitans sucicola]
MKKTLAAFAATTLAAGLAIGAAVPAQAGIVLYQYSDYKTSLGDFGRGTSFVGTKANDKASSLKVSAPAGYAILHQHRDYVGKRTGKFLLGTPSLSSWSFDNTTSSVS